MMRVRPWLFLLPLLLARPAFAADEPRFSQADLRADLRQLAQVIDSAHPDPYVRGGGRVAFSRRLDEALRAIPAGGMTAREFWRVAAPVVASVRDGHTSLSAPAAKDGAAAPSPIAFGFRIVEQDLVVSSVAREDERALIGSRLVAIEGVPMKTLVERQGRLRGYDNVYGNLVHLAAWLANRDRLADLIPEWNGGASVALSLRSPAGKPVAVTTSHPGAAGAVGGSARESLTLPVPFDTEQGFGFLDPARRIGYLRISTMMGYREAFEMALARGADWILPWAANVWKRHNQGEPPKEPRKLLEGVPSATELFREMVRQMKDAGTSTLIVDVRDNDGGSSAMSSMLDWFLWGRQAVLDTDGGYQVPRYSELFFADNPGRTLEQINEGHALPIERGEEDFTEERAWRALRLPGATKPSPEAVREWERMTKEAPTFGAEVARGTYERYYRPARIVVLSSAKTYSAGFDIAADLVNRGAVLVGVPSAQAGNCFIDALPFTLAHSGLRGQISFKDSRMFPDDPAKGEVLRPTVELTYAAFRDYGFDPNAEVRLALDALHLVAAKPRRGRR